MKPRRNRAGDEPEMEPVEVFARIKTVNETNKHNLCIDYIDEKTIECYPPASVVSDKGMRATFTKVFDQGSSQNEVFDEIARPMVSKLLDGRSGLLFNYGVTCSGKTYTMTGSPSTPGFLPRALEMIFSSIEGRQTKEFQIQPDDKNGFRLLNDTEMMSYRLEKRNDLVSSRIMRSRADTASVDYDIGEHYMHDLKEGIKYGVFMSYIDIYNEQIFDLLAETRKGKQPAALRIRDNADRGVYASGVTLKEVRSLSDAFRTYERGLKQRRNAETSLNLASSRSHAILTLHVVRVPVDTRTDEIFEDIDVDLTPNASSLHLVDLAGSERAARTNAHVDSPQREGDRLKEAGSINNSLMTLRRCIDGLRNNQRNGAKGPVPYRSSKLTHLFRNFFEVIGGVKLVICVNPSGSEFDENLNVLSFAEAANSIVCKREAPIAEFDIQEMVAKATEKEKKSRRRTIHEAWKVNEDAFATGPTLQCFQLFNVEDAEMLSNVMLALRDRIERREVGEEEMDRMTTTFRKKLNHFERETIDSVGKLRIMEPQIEKQEAEIERLTNDNKKLERKNRALMETKRMIELDRKDMESELQSKTNRLNQTEAQKKRIELDSKKKLQDVERSYASKTQRIVMEKEAEAQRKIQDKEARLDRLKEIMASRGQQPRTPMVSRGRHAAAATPSTTRAERARNLRKRSVSASRVLDDLSDDPSMTPKSRQVKNSSASNLRDENRAPSKPQRSAERIGRPVQPDFYASSEALDRHELEQSPLKESASRRSRGAIRSRHELYNTRHETTEHLARRRSQSADGKRKWLAHTPKETVNTGTVLQNSVYQMPQHKRSSSSSSLKSFTMDLVKKAINKVSNKPKVGAERRVHVPNMSDLKKTDQYLLTSQEQSGDKIKTTLVKGHIDDTRTGGIQVRFTGKERLTSDGLRGNTRISTSRGSRGKKRRSDDQHSEPESMDSQSTAFTDVATRCNVAVVHQRGASEAHVTNAQSKQQLNQSQTSIRIVGRTGDQNDHMGMTNEILSFQGSP